MKKKELLEYVQGQIQKIKMIIELKKLQILCRLKMMKNKLVRKTYSKFPKWNSDIDFQICFYQKFLGQILKGRRANV